MEKNRVDRLGVSETIPDNGFVSLGSASDLILGSKTDDREEGGGWKDGPKYLPYEDPLH